MALSFAAQGEEPDAVAAALMSRGCSPAEAERIAKQAIDMQPQSSQSQHMPSVAKPQSAQNFKPLKFMLQVLGLMAAASFLFAMTQVNKPRVRETVPPAATSAIANYVLPTPAPSKSWSIQLPPEVIRFDESSGQGEIRYFSFPTSEEYFYFREKQKDLFSIKLLQIVPMTGGRQLLLFSSQPPDFDCHACHPLLSAMLVKGGSGQPYVTILPLQIIGTGGTFGNLSLEGERRVSLLKVGPLREGFVFKDGDSGQGSVVEWGNLFSIEKDRLRALGLFHVHEDSFNSGFCEERKKELCAQKDTKIRFARDDASRDYVDILATEVSVDPSKGNALPVTRNYVLRFNGEQYAEVVEATRAPAALAPLIAEEPASASKP